MKLEEIENTQDYLINEWLMKYEPIKEIAQTIHSETLTTETDSLAMQRTGFENLPLRYVTDRGWLRQYQYMLLLKGESETDYQKLTNFGWLDDLSDWLSKQNAEKNFPILENGKKVVEVSCANAITYETSDDGAISTYYIQIYFNIRKEEE